MNGYLTSMAGLLQVLLLFWGALVWLISTMQEILTMARSISACGAILCEYFSGGSGIRMQKIPLLDWFYAINQDDNLLIFY
ncbi:hypothetical protein OkiPb00505_47850 [Escherichia coli]